MIAAGLFVGLLVFYLIEPAAMEGQQLLEEDMQLEVTPATTNATVSLQTELQGTLQLFYWREGEEKQAVSAELFPGRDTHIFVLDGLQPASTYSVEGVLTDEAGNVHRLEVRKFTTLPEGAAAGSDGNMTNATGENTTGAAGGGIAGDGGGSQEDDSGGSGSSGSGGTTDTVQYYKTFSFNESKSVIDIGLQTAAYTTSGYMRFKVFVEGEEFGPFEVPDDEQLYKRSMATIGQNFTVGVIEKSGPDVEVEEFTVFEE